ncbi:MAG: cysteine synthase family protein [Pelagibacteraceae bacterium TMED247]|nr:MAG: cysteine synthase family protein [Pelagibacteraceae bacterium TMED247]
MFGSIVGKTPLIKLNSKIYAKLEAYNPSGSIKDRMVSYLVQKGIQNEQIFPDSKFVEATSGNTGIALSMIGASMGVEVHIIMPSNMSKERVQMMEAYGAIVHKVGHNDFKGAIEKRDKMLSSSKKWWSPMQFSNPYNIEAHYVNTANEIHEELRALGLSWSAFVAGAGTGGTMMGVCNFIRDNGLETKAVLTTPAEPSDSHGIQGINDGADFLLDKSRVDCVMKIKTKDAIDRAKLFARESGLLVGISSGANMLAAERWAEQNEVGGIIVTILCDRGERYLDIYNS